MNFEKAARDTAPPVAWAGGVTITDINAINDTLREAFNVEDIPRSTRAVIGQRLKYEPRFYIENLLKIQNKEGALVPFRFNPAQVRLYEEYMRQRDLGQPVRIIILKARQLGFSTLVSGLFFQHCVTHKDVSAAIVAHQAQASTNIFNKHKTFLDGLPDEFQPMVKNSNAKEILFENPSLAIQERRARKGMNSRIRIFTAVSKDAARSATIQLLHISELAFWAYPEETFTALMQTVPNTPNSVVIIESTANGVGNFFHRQWQMAERGESAYTPMFFPWYEEEGYRQKVPEDFFVTEEEQELKDRCSLDDEQLCWRRWCIRANCGGSGDQFRQEYPSAPNEAFLASGRPVFDVGSLEAARHQCTKPEAEGRVMETDGKVVFQSGYNGYLKIWNYPDDGHQYVIGIDTSEGLANGDYSVMEVFDRTTRAQVAEWHGHIDPDLLGIEAARLGRYYKLAWLIPEANNTGIATIKALRRQFYPKIYRRRSTPDKTGDQPADRYGFWTGSGTKPLLISDFGTYIREEWKGFRSKDLLDECLSYVYDDQGHTNAQIGCHDDRVIAAALAVFGMKEQPSYEAAMINENFAELYGSNSVTGY